MPARKYLSDIQASQAAPNTLTITTSHGHCATTDPRPNTADDIRMANPSRIPPRSGNERCQPNSAPEDISRMLFGPGVIALMKANPVRLTRRVVSMQINRRVPLELFHCYCKSAGDIGDDSKTSNFRQRAA